MLNLVEALDIFRKWASEAQRETSVATLTKFQLECERRLLALLSSAGTRLEQRVLAGKTELYVTGRIAGTDITVWIYGDEAEFGGEGIDCRFEAPDFDTEAELIEGFLRKLEEKLTTARARRGRSPKKG